MNNGQNTDLNNQNIEFRGPLKAITGPIMNLPRAITTLYVQEYPDITLNTEFGKSRTNLGKRSLRNPNY